MLNIFFICKYLPNDVRTIQNFFVFLVLLAQCFSWSIKPSTGCTPGKGSMATWKAGYKYNKQISSFVHLTKAEEWIVWNFVLTTSRIWRRGSIVWRKFGMLTTVLKVIYNMYPTLSHLDKFCMSIYPLSLILVSQPLHIGNSLVPHSLNKLLHRRS